MTCETSRAAAGLRKAVESGAYEEAGRWLAEYSREVTAVVGRSRPGDPRAAERVSEARALLNWAVRAVRCARAHTGGGLARLAASRTYCDPPSVPESTLKLVG